MRVAFLVGAFVLVAVSAWMGSVIYLILRSQ